MHGTRENAAQYNPKEGRRAELRAHDGAEDGPRSRDVEELDHIDLPGRHWDEVHAVSLGDGGSGPCGVGPEDFLDELTVDEIAQYQGEEADQERNHG